MFVPLKRYGCVVRFPALRRLGCVPGNVVKGVTCAELCLVLPSCSSCLVVVLLWFMFVRDRLWRVVVVCNCSVPIKRAVTVYRNTGGK